MRTDKEIKQYINKLKEELTTYEPDEDFNLYENTNNLIELLLWILE